MVLELQTSQEAKESDTEFANSDLVQEWLAYS